MEYKEMTDTELAQIMVNYITRTEHLCRLISNYLDGSDRGTIPAERIKEEYKQLKYELRDDAHYLDLSKNRKGSKLYMFFFSPSIRKQVHLDFAYQSLAQ